MATIPDLTLDAGLPANLDAEKTILGAILLDNAAHAEAAEHISPDDFSLDSHRRIFLRMSELIDTGRTVDIVTLSNELSRYKEVEAVGGVAYLASLTEGLPRRPVIEDYIRIVKDKSLLRRLMGICSAAIAKAADQSQDAIGVLDETESQLLEVSQSGLSLGLQPINDIVRDSFGSIDNLYNHRGDITGLETGFTDFDRMTSGLQKGELIIIAARPSMGKTALAINIAQNAAVRHKAIVAIFSLEMSKESLLRRMLASQASVDQQKIQKGFFGRAEQEKLQDALSLLVESHIFIDDSAASTIAEMRAKARRLKQNSGGLDLIMIDYLQLMSATMSGASKRGFENRVQEVSAISRGLKAMAKELQVPVIALSQLSRSNEKRDDKRPMLSDLRESGSIEQDADVVAFIHREAYYNRKEDLSAEEKAEAEIIIAKQRNGPTGIVKMHWNSAFTRFDGVDSHHEAE
ncbi:MAG TPA: replicative DNA helicase [Terracidiphilus sp.]|nr:replicative DNA helicase [Terracidiphilus sp.]